MNRNLLVSTIVFKNDVRPTDLRIIPDEFEGNVVVIGNLVGEGDILFKGALWVTGEVELDGDIEVNYIEAKGINCISLRAEDVRCIGDLVCYEIIVTGDLSCVSIATADGLLLGGLIDCEYDVNVLGTVLCKAINSTDLYIKGNLHVYENIVAGDLSVKGDIFCKGNIMAEDIIVSGSIYCGKNINTDQDLTVKRDVMCDDIIATDIVIDGYLFCEDITARDVKVERQLKCNKIEARSFNADYED